MNIPGVGVSEEYTKTQLRKGKWNKILTLRKIREMSTENSMYE
jgi:hypothetical protein